MTVAFAMGFALAGVWCGAAMAQTAALPEDSVKAVILVYMRVGEEAEADSTLPTAQFEEHLTELERGGYHVRPLPEILEAIRNGTPLPAGTLALTFDGAYRSTYRNAIPRLLEKKIPFTLFYASDPLDQTLPDFMSWADLQTLARYETVTLGVLPASASHITRLPAQGMISQLNKARQRFREKFGQEVNLLSYPFGEYSLTLKTLAHRQGFSAAFGLQSGALSQKSDFYALPRFTMTEHYGDLERFRMVAHALPLPVTELEPENPALRSTQEWMTGFTLPPALANESQNLSCFIAGEATPHIERLGARIEIRSITPLTGIDKIRINCTMPGPATDDQEAQWRWLGLLYYRPENTGLSSGPALTSTKQPAPLTDTAHRTATPPDEPPALLE